MSTKQQTLADQIQATTDELDNSCTKLLSQADKQIKDLEISWPAIEKRLNSSYNSFISDMNKGLANHLVKVEHILSGQE